MHNVSENVTSPSLDTKTFFFSLFKDVYVSNSIRTCSSIEPVYLRELYSTFISARYCMPLEICHAKEIRSPMVSALSSGFSR